MEDIELLARSLTGREHGWEGGRQCLFREFFRSLFSANLFVTGIILTIAAVVLFHGSIYLFNYTNLGKRLGPLVTGAAVSGWLTITSMLFVAIPHVARSRRTSRGWNAPRSGSSRSHICWCRWCISLAFLVALHQYEEVQRNRAMALDFSVLGT